MQALVGSEFPKQVVPKINEAKKSIDIIVFDWRWYPNMPGNPVQLFNQSIIRAVKRNVEVRVITNISDTIKFLSSNGVKTKKPVTDRLIHPKLMIIDNQDVVIGSHNYSQSAFTMNYEVSVFVPDCPCVDELLTFFNNLFGHG